jgi:hypothetical protein
MSILKLEGIPDSTCVKMTITLVFIILGIIPLIYVMARSRRGEILHSVPLTINTIALISGVFLIISKIASMFF